MATEHRLKQTFGLDLRSLALFRVSIATLVLTDLCLRARDLTAHYTDAGVLPRVYFRIDPTRWSLHLVSGSAYFQAFMFLLAGAFAICLLLGCRTRLATFFSFVLLVSLQGRNWMILDSGDRVLAMLLFWGMFLPLGARFSIDGRRNPLANAVSDLHFSVATLALIVQLCLIYWIPVLRRTDPDWWNGNALYYALHYEPVVTEWGLWLRESNWPLSALSLCVIWWEAVGPLLLWIPVWTQWLRLFAIVGFVMLHAGIAMTMTIGFFSSVCIAGWLALLPAIFWNAVLGVREGRIIPHLASRISHPSARQPVPQRGFSWNDLIALFFLLYIVAWNLRVVDSRRFGFPNYLNVVAYVCSIRQNWNMFTPSPPKRNTWYVVPARLRIGQEIDLMSGEAVTWQKPRLISQQFRNYRWWRYFINLEDSPGKTHWQFFSAYATRTWNQSHSPSEQLEEFSFYAMYEETEPDHVTEPQKQKLWTYRAPN